MKIGDRVRINCPGNPRHGLEATIWDITDKPFWWDAKRRKNGGAAYRLDVDGEGRISKQGSNIAFFRHELIPIQPLGSWEETFKGTDFDIRRERVRVS